MNLSRPSLSLIIVCLFYCTNSAFAQEAGAPKPAADLGATMASTLLRVEKATNEATQAASLAATAATKALSIANDAKEKAEVANDTAALSQSGKLMTNGLTGGISYAIQFAGHFNKRYARQDSGKGVAMPYILVLPGFWTASEPLRVACASEWGGGDENTTDEAARAVARKRAVRIFSAVESWKIAKNDSQADLIANALSIIYDNGDREINRDIVNAIQKYVESKNSSPELDRQEKRKAIIEWMAHLEWRATQKARCWPRRFGIWAGLPTSFEAQTTVPLAKVDAQKTATRKLNPIASFGVAFSPNAYFSLLTGFTASSVQRDNSAGREVERTVWSTTIGIGGNLDFITALVK